MTKSRYTYLLNMITLFGEWNLTLYSYKLPWGRRLNPYYENHNNNPHTFPLLHFIYLIATHTYLTVVSIFHHSITCFLAFLLLMSYFIFIFTFNWIVSYGANFFRWGSNFWQGIIEKLEAISDLATSTFTFLDSFFWFFAELNRSLSYESSTFQSGP